MNLELVDCTSDVTVTVTSPLRHICPFADEIDRGHIDITWRVDGKTIELWTLRTWLDGFADFTLSHEAITDLIRRDLSTFSGIKDVTVSSRWHTAGMEVACRSISPILADLL